MARSCLQTLETLPEDRWLQDRYSGYESINCVSHQFSSLGTVRSNYYEFSCWSQVLNSTGEWFMCRNY